MLSYDRSILVLYINKLIKSILFFCCFFILINPFNPLALNPLSNFLISILHVVFSLAVLLTILPSPYVFPSVRPIKGPLPMFFIVFIISLIFSPICPFYLAIPMHFIMLPIAFVFSVFTPYIFAYIMKVLPLP